jgi:hypothetical protein
LALIQVDNIQPLWRKQGRDIATQAAVGIEFSSLNFSSDIPPL